MEIPYTGRAIINDNLDSVEIVIPVKKIWFPIIFLPIWLCGWCFGEVFAITTLLSHGPIFLLIWLCAWTFGGLFAIRIFIWSAFGKEIIIIRPGVISIDKKGLIPYKAKSYDLNEAKNFRAVEDPNNGFYYGMRQNSFTTNTGTIKFDYGMETIKFGASLSEAEGNYILDKLRQKRLIK